MAHVLDLLAQLSLPGRALLLDVHQPVVEPVETVAQDGLRVEALDISRYRIVEVDFDEDLTRANEFVGN